MASELGGIGVSAARLSVPLEEQARLTEAVREAVRRHSIALISYRTHANARDLIRCPRCGDRVIVLDEPGTFVFDRDEKDRICSACGAERAFIQILWPDADIGGEGG